MSDNQAEMPTRLTSESVGLIVKYNKERGTATPQGETLVTIEGPGPLNPITGPIDWSKPVQTRHGVPVRIYAIDHNLRQPVIGRRMSNDEAECWHLNGAFFPSSREESCLDIINVPEGGAK